MNYVYSVTKKLTFYFHKGR